MPTNFPLQNKTIILTGTSKTTDVMAQIQLLGGTVLHYPLIETREIIDNNDAMELELARTFDWLIFTSVSAVEVFYEKMKRMHFESWQFKGKIAAVGEKTAEALRHIGFVVSFMPSTYSADVFVKEFPDVAEHQPKCLFLRGNLARNTLQKGLPFPIQQWTIYETVEMLPNTKPLIEEIKKRQEVIVIFASPSAVDLFALYVVPEVGWERIKVATIGHVTATAIQQYGIEVDFHPTTYTMQAVLAEIVKSEG